MRTVVQKPKAAHQPRSATPNRAHFGQNREVNSILHLQRTIGNHAAQRLLKAEAEDLEVRSVSKVSSALAHDLSRIPMHDDSSRHQVQFELKVNKLGDQYEREADRVADQVMQAQDASVGDQASALDISRLPSTSPAMQGQIEGGEEEEMLQARAADSSGASLSVGSEALVSRARQSSGQPLPDTIRARMEPAFGVDFSAVRLHSGGDAATAASAVQARAFTIGSDIVFGAGEKRLDTSTGQHLLAHELTHVVQQTGVQSKEPSRGPANSQHPVCRSSLSASSGIVQRAVLTDEQRINMVENTADETHTAHTDYTNGAQDAERVIEQANRAEAEIAKALFAAGMSFIVPGFGGLVARGFTHFGVTVSANLAANIGNAIGEIAKSAGNQAIDDHFQPDSPNAFFVLVTDGWEAAAREQRRYIRTHKTNREVLSDNTLTELYDYWRTLAGNNNRNDWNQWFQEEWTRYQAQVAPIGERTAGRYGSMKARWIEGAHWRGLALTGEGRYYNVGSGPNFITWISPTYRAAAIQATERIGRVDTVHYGNLIESEMPFFQYLDRPALPPHSDNVTIARSTGTTRPPSRSVCPSCHGETGGAGSARFPEIEFPSSPLLQEPQRGFSEADQRALEEFIRSLSEE